MKQIYMAALIGLMCVSNKVPAYEILDFECTVELPDYFFEADAEAVHKFKIEKDSDIVQTDITLYKIINNEYQIWKHGEYMAKAQWTIDKLIITYHTHHDDIPRKDIIDRNNLSFYAFGHGVGKCAVKKKNKKRVF
jgi:hypothetical protein